MDPVKRILLLGDRPVGADAVLFVFRLVVGAFLVWGVWDNVVSAERMAEFAAFLEASGFAYPEAMAPLSVWAQLACGVAFVLGLLTRWAGIVCAINFIVAVVMVDAQNGVRAAFPATMLVLFGAYLAARGAGRWSIDRLIAS